MYWWVLLKVYSTEEKFTHLKKFIKLVKNQSECVKNESLSNLEIVSNENMSMSNQCESNQDKSESSVCDSHYASLKFQLRANNPEIKPVR